ncbi:MAG: hypothetical protein IJ837_02005 [Clostridia bacterium]|nr:hypothetical protein [Clostridia bacterium]
MSGYLMGNVIYGFYNFLQDIFKGVDFDWLFFIGIGLTLVFIIAGFIRMAFSFERKTTRCINKINRYLLQKPAITDDNLVEFHKMLQKMPRRIRDRWQLYILERDGLPSRYLTAEYCIRRPLSSSILIGIKQQTKLFAIVLSIISYVIGLGFSLAGSVSDATQLANVLDYIIIYPLITPLAIMLLCSLFSMIVSIRYNAYNAKLYNIFAVFVRNLNRAVATMPDSIDFEVLFTKQEIDEGIPILREYLEKENLEKQRLLEQSKYAAIAHSPYNFEDLGVDGEQLISRAVDESENFLMKKIGLQNEIQDFEKKLAQAQANMDEIEKEANRKLQTIKENLERLDKAISETTNRVEINYNRRQIKDEMEKRAAIEKDLKSLLAKEQVTINECNAEILKRKDLIEKDKDSVEVALKSEYNTFAVKVYDTLSEKINEENAEVAKDYQSQIVDLKAKMQNLEREIETKNALIAERDLFINTLQGNVNYGGENLSGNNPDANGIPAQDQSLVTAEQNYMTNENVQQQSQQVYYDENGNAIDYSQYYDENGNLVDYSQFYDENGNLIDYSKYYDENGNYIGPTQEEWNQMYAQGQVASENEQEQPLDEQAKQQAENTDNKQAESEEQKEPKNDEKEDLNEAEESAMIEEATLEALNSQEAEKTEQPEPKPQIEEKTEKEAKNTNEPTKPMAINAPENEAKEEKKPRKPRAKSRALDKRKPKSTSKPKTKKPATKKSGNKINVADESVNYAISNSKDDFEEIQKKIDEESEKIKQNKDELQDQIDKALNKIEKSSTENSREKSIKKIKELIEQLKEKAKQAKANGASKEEIKNINASVAELVEAITKFSTKK